MLRLGRKARMIAAGATVPGRETPISTQGGPLHAAKEYHQQYVDKVPNGPCGLAGTGVSCPAGLTAA